MSISLVRCHSLRGSLVGPGRIEKSLPARPSGADPGSPTLLLTARLTERCPSHQRLARVGPTVRMGVMSIVVLQKRTQTPLELRRACEVAALEESPRQHAEPQLHLVQPRAILRREVKHVRVR